MRTLLFLGNLGKDKIIIKTIIVLLLFGGNNTSTLHGR